MPWLCGICNDVFARKQNYDRHLLTQRHKKRADNDVQLFKCIGCQKTFSSKLSLENHRKNVCQTQELERQDSSENIKNEETIKLLHETISKLSKEIEDIKSQIERPAKRRNIRHPISSQERRNIIESQQNKCNTCSSELSDYYEIDHIIAMQFGGTDELNNLQALCCECHARKSRTENKKRQQIKDAIYAIIYGNQNQEDNIQTVLSTTP